MKALAGLIAGAYSLAIGEWLSVTNARELPQAQVSKEENELENGPESEEHELALIHKAKGMSADEAKRVAAQMMKEEKALDVLVREGLALDPAELGGNPWSRTSVPFRLSAVGAVFSSDAILVVSGFRRDGSVHCIQRVRVDGNRCFHVAL